MTRTLSDARTEPADEAVWIYPSDAFALVRADRAQPSTADLRWYLLQRIGTRWVLCENCPWTWQAVDGTLPDNWPMTEGPPDLHDLVMREVGR